MTPQNEHNRRLIDEAVRMAYGDVPEEETVKGIFKIGVQINQEVHASFKQFLAANQGVTRGEVRDKLMRLYVDDIKSYSLTKEDLIFLLAFNCAKILYDQYKQ